MTDWYSMPILSGRYVRLEPLAPSHAPGLLEAADDDSVFQHLTKDRPRSVEAAAEFVAWALDLRERQVLMPFAQLDVRDGDGGPGEVAGHTSYYEIQPESRSIAIGYTWLGKRFWRSGINTESKLLLLEHAFDTLEAVRVVWHTDIRNSRSQEAIARLGAEREGVLRKHKVRRDGTWRDTVQFAMTDDDWPDVRTRLRARLESA